MLVSRGTLPQADGEGGKRCQQKRRVTGVVAVAVAAAVSAVILSVSNAKQPPVDLSAVDGALWPSPLDPRLTVDRPN